MHSIVRSKDGHWRKFDPLYIAKLYELRVQNRRVRVSSSSSS